MKGNVKNFYLIGTKVIVNSTIQMLKNEMTTSSTIRTQLRKVSGRLPVLRLL